MSSLVAALSIQMSVSSRLASVEMAQDNLTNRQYELRVRLFYSVVGQF